MDGHHAAPGRRQNPAYRPAHRHNRQGTAVTRTLASQRGGFTAQRLPAVLVKTRKMLDAVNAIFLRAAQAEVACHPEDAKAIRQTYSRLDRLPRRS